jgi:tetratricopeptide (TPR) repeat protein
MKPAARLNSAPGLKLTARSNLAPGLKLAAPLLLLLLGAGALLPGAAGAGAGTSAGREENLRGRGTARTRLMDKDTVSPLLSEGHKLFLLASNTKDTEEALHLYRMALYRYERILLEEGVQNGALYYNIANTYFRIGDLGRAILNYRRAQLFSPADPNLRHNLRYARSRRIDQIQDQQASSIVRILFFWHYLLSVRTRVYLFVILFGMVCIAASVYLFRREALPGRRGRDFRTAITAGAAAAVLLLGSMTANEIRLRTMSDGVILEQVMARKGDGKAYQPSFIDPLHPGTEIKVLEERVGWYRIRIADGRTAWIPSSAAELVLETLPPAHEPGIVEE